MSEAADLLTASLIDLALEDTLLWIPALREVGRHSLRTPGLDKLREELDAAEKIAGIQRADDRRERLSRALERRPDWAEEFSLQQGLLRRQFLSQPAAEAALDQHWHGAAAVPLALADLQTLLEQAPAEAAWIRVRTQGPADVVKLVAEARGKFVTAPAEGYRHLRPVRQQPGAVAAVLCHHLALAALAVGQVAEAQQALERAVSTGHATFAMFEALAILQTQPAPPVGLAVWPTWPRGGSPCLIAEVGRGPVTSVYYAHQELGRGVAVKIPATDHWDQAAVRDRVRAAFEGLQALKATPAALLLPQELKALADPHSGRPTIAVVQEFATGASLARRLAVWRLQHLPPPYAEIFQVMEPVCDALDVAHRYRPAIIHGALHPGQVVVDKAPGGIRLTDLAIARALHGPAGPGEVRDDVQAAARLLRELLTLSPHGDLDERPDCPPAWRELLADALHPSRRKAPTMGKVLERLREGARQIDRPSRSARKGQRPRGKPDLVVCPHGGGDCRTIAEALRRARPGATVRIRPGTYLESLTLTQAVVLEADGRDVIVESDRNCLAMRAGRAVVRGLTLRQRVGGGSKHCAVDVPQGDLVLEDCDVSSEGLACVAVHGAAARPVLRGCRLHDGAEGGVFCYDHAAAVLEDCEVFATTLAGVECKTDARLTLRRCHLHGGQAGGAFAWDRGTITLEHCDVHDQRLAGLESRQAGTVVARHCKLHDGGEGGVYVWKQGQGLIEHCDIFGNGLAGVLIADGGDPVVRHCTIHHGKQGGAYVYANGKGTLEHCDLHHNALANLQIREGSDPLVRHCRIHDGKEGGVYVNEQGLGRIEDCDIFANALANVQSRTGGHPTLRRCQIHGGKQSGVFINDGGRGLFEDCDVHGNAFAGVEIRKGGDPVVRRCHVHDGKEGGVYAYDEGRGTVEHCDVHGHGLANVQFRKGADPVVRHCLIHDGKQGGLLVNEQARGTVEGCEIYGNAFAGVEIRDGGDPALTRCTVRAGKAGGVYVHANGRGTFSACTITDHPRSGVETRGGGHPTLRQCRIGGNAYEAVWVHDGGTATVEDCDLTGNRRGAWDVAAGCQVRRQNNQE